MAVFRENLSSAAFDATEFFFDEIVFFWRSEISCNGGASPTLTNSNKRTLTGPGKNSTLTHTRTHTHSHTHAHALTLFHIYTRTHSRTHTHTYSRSHTLSHTQSLNIPTSHPHTQTHTHTHTYTHTHTHTHALTQTLTHNLHTRSHTPSHKIPFTYTHSSTWQGFIQQLSATHKKLSWKNYNSFVNVSYRVLLTHIVSVMLNSNHWNKKTTWASTRGQFLVRITNRHWPLDYLRNLVS